MEKDKQLSCKNCFHFSVCKLIERLQGSIKRHKRIFRPSDGLGPGEKLYRVVAEDCFHYVEAFTRIEGENQNE